MKKIKVIRGMFLNGTNYRRKKEYRVGEHTERRDGERWICQHDAEVLVRLDAAEVIDPPNFIEGSEHESA